MIGHAFAISGQGSVHSPTVRTLLDRIGVAARRLGAEVYSAPVEDGLLREVENAVAPLRFPAEVLYLWRHVDPDTYPVATDPDLAPLDGVLTSWKRDVTAGLIPARLFPFCNTGWAFTYVELHSAAADDGGALFEWMHGGADFQLSYDNLADWLTVQLEAIAAGAVEVRAGRIHLNGRPLHHLQYGPARLKRRGPHEIYGQATAIPEHAWPDRWR